MVVAPESLWLAAEPLLGQLGAPSQVEQPEIPQSMDKISLLFYGGTYSSKTGISKLSGKKVSSLALADLKISVVTTQPCSKYQSSHR